ncbi:MAG: DUF4783 domain-containing protein [Bacteroidales bacterium]|nr:DUF4783 domain-containing protein [Bacteroidales bacterium]MCL2133478.1 DUF4783 domain-containing protein [Bacteroidales bacterium]
MKKLTNLILCLLLFAPLPAQTDCKPLFEPIAETLRKTDFAAFSDYFAKAIECNILGEEQTYSKEQALQVIRNFFNVNGEVRSYTIKHCSGKEYLKYAIGNLTTTNGSTYRITLFVSLDEGNKPKIQQLRITHNS